jgi:hypothetical protein
MVPEGQGGLHKRRFKIVEIIVLEGKVGDTRGETIFKFVCWEESFRIKYVAKINQTWYKHFLQDGNSS